MQTHTSPQWAGSCQAAARLSEPEITQTGPHKYKGSNLMLDARCGFIPLVCIEEQDLALNPDTLAGLHVLVNF